MSFPAGTAASARLGSHCQDLSSQVGTETNVLSLIAGQAGVSDASTAPQTKATTLRTVSRGPLVSINKKNRSLQDKRYLCAFINSELKRIQELCENHRFCENKHNLKTNANNYASSRALPKGGHILLSIVATQRRGHKISLVAAMSHETMSVEP